MNTEYEHSTPSDGEDYRDNFQMKECPTCGRIKKSNPTPDGDEICPSCGDREMMDKE